MELVDIFANRALSKTNNMTLGNPALNSFLHPPRTCAHLAGLYLLCCKRAIERHGKSISCVISDLSCVMYHTIVYLFYRLNRRTYVSAFEKGGGSIRCMFGKLIWGLGEVFYLMLQVCV